VLQDVLEGLTVGGERMRTKIRRRDVHAEKAPKKGGFEGGRALTEEG
jgi:hypothetical protein